MSRRENRSAPGIQRKVAGIAQTVRKKKARDAITTVAIAYVEDSLGIALGTNEHVLVSMNARLGGAGAAGRIQPKGGSLFAHRRGVKFRGRFGHRVAQTKMALLRFAGNDDLPQIFETLARSHFQERKE